MSKMNLSEQYSIIGTSVKTDFDLMRRMANDLVSLAVVKDLSYGSSWKARGGIGAYMTTVRKSDRLEAQMKKNGYNVFDVSIAPDDSESIDETIKDAINYYLLILTTRELIRRELKDNPIKGVTIESSTDNDGSEPTSIGYVDQD